ncbi:MAG: phage holin family protein [Trueperaceae bacterium]|nr:phage holin family protein [Trueperaceae bacterium]
MSIFARWLISAAALWLTAQLNVGLSFSPSGFIPIMITALVLGLVNVLVKPIMILLTLPFTILTFGLFLLVVNALSIALVATLTPLTISGFWGAIIGAVVLSIINAVLTQIFSRKEKD